MPSKYMANKFFEKHKHATFRHTNQELEQLLRFAEKEYGKHLLEVSTTELHRAFFRANNGFEKREKLECAYATWHSYDQIDCAKDFDQKGRIHKVTESFCNHCYERQQRQKCKP